MKFDSLFKEKTTIRLWNQYLDRAQETLRKMDLEQRNDIILEIKSHLIDSFNQDQATQETDRLLNAQKRLGDPGLFLKPMMADRLLDQGAKSLNPNNIIKGLYYSLFGGIKNMLIALGFFVGYFFAFLFAVIALLKPFFPENVGLILENSGEWALGVTFDPMVDLIGFWTIPLSLSLFGLTFWGLSKMLNFRKKWNIEK